MNYKIFFSRFTFFVLAFVALGTMSALSQNKTIKRMGALNTVSFDEGWLFMRYGLQPDGSRKEEPTGLEASSYNDGNWQGLKLPHDWAITGPFRIELDGATGKLPWKGIGWYRKHFIMPGLDKGKQIFIDFDGAMANAKIWLNGHYIGTWPYGYSSFRMDLTKHINWGGKNTLAVRLDTENWDSRWYPGAGIYRHVWLVKTNPVHVGHWGTYITTPKITKDAAVVKMDLTVDNASAKKINAIVRTSLHELNEKNIPSAQVVAQRQQGLSINANSTAKADIEMTLQHPKRWDIATPNRYVAKTELLINGRIIDTYFTPFGVRTIEFTARNGFLLNGKRVEIKGTCNHHDLGALGAAFNSSAQKRQLQMLKEMGCNSLRTSHNPPAPELLEMADQMGFLVWDEAFDTWKRGKRKKDYNKLYDEWHEKDLVALVHRDRNHPSVFIWSIGNEVMDQQNVPMTKHLVDIVKREDPTRPVSNGYNDPNGGRKSGAAKALDMMGVNYFFDRQAEWDTDSVFKNMPTIGSETSSTVSSRGEYFFGNGYKNWQISSYDNMFPGWGCSPDTQFAINKRFPHLLGEYVWTGFDYLGEPTPYNSDETNLLNFRTDASKQVELQKKLDSIRKSNPPSRSSYFGIIDLAGFPKDRYYSYQAEWRADKPMAHILPHWNWPERIDSITPIHVYTSGDEAELFLNGKSLGRKTKTAGKDFRLVWPDVKYAPGEVKVIAYKNGKQWAKDVVKTTGNMSKLKLSADRAIIKADGEDLCFVTVKVTDQEGLLVPRSNPNISFTVEGPGEIVATDNGDATSYVPFQSHERPAYNGMALVIVRAKQSAKGTFTVKAASNGLTSGSTQIKVQ